MITIIYPRFRFLSLVSCEALAFRERNWYSSIADAENVSVVLAADDEKYGFKRQEMYTSSLAGSITPYARHVFLCYKRPDAWLPRVEDEELPKLFSSAFNARKADFAVVTKLTVCRGGESDGDVLIFPEMIRYRGLKDSDVDAFVEDVLVSGKPWASWMQEVLAGSYIFVCCHASRDKRCGVCGLALIEMLKQGIESRGLLNQIFVKPCSHVGGHKYAGNLIIFSPDSAGNISGHWYGYVTPDDVPELLDQHIAKGEIIKRIWRGQMGQPAGEVEKPDEQNLPNGSTIGEGKETEESKTLENKEFVEGCCQGANGVSCCRKEKPEPTRKKRTCNLPSWIGSPKKNEFLVGASVIGAVATVVIAYTYYRRSG